jgi:hypothetical protein
VPRYKSWYTHRSSQRSWREMIQTHESTPYGNGRAGDGPLGTARASVRTEHIGIFGNGKRDGLHFPVAAMRPHWSMLIVVKRLAVRGNGPRSGHPWPSSNIEGLFKQGSLVYMFCTNGLTFLRIRRSLRSCFQQLKANARRRRIRVRPPSALPSLLISSTCKRRIKSSAAEPLRRSRGQGAIPY